MRRTAVIRPCRKEDLDPDRPASEQRYCLYTKSKPTKLLGRHPSAADAEKQEAAIHARGGNTMHRNRLAEVPESALKSLYKEEWAQGVMKALGEDFDVDSKSAQFLFYSVWNGVIQLMDRVLEKQLGVDTKSMSGDPTFMQSLAGLAYFVADDALKKSLGVKSDSLQKGAGHLEALMAVTGQDAPVDATLKGLSQQALPIASKAFDQLTSYLKEEVPLAASAGDPKTARNRLYFVAFVRRGDTQSLQDALVYMASFRRGQNPWRVASEVLDEYFQSSGTEEDWEVFAETDGNLQAFVSDDLISFETPKGTVVIAVSPRGVETLHPKLDRMISQAQVVKQAVTRTASYWMLPEDTLYSLLGIPESFEHFDLHHLPEGVPESAAQEFYDALWEEGLGKVEEAAERVLDDSRYTAKQAIDQYLQQHGQDPEDAESELWYKNMADDFAHETFFGLRGGDPEYNEIHLTYAPEMFEWLGMDEDPSFIDAIADKAHEAGAEAWEGWVDPTVREAWEEAKRQTQVQQELPLEARSRDAGTADVLDVVRSHIDQGLKQYDAWFDSEAGAHYARDFDRLVDAWIDNITETVLWAEESGTGDITGVEDAYPRQLAQILFKIAPTSDATEDSIFYDLEELTNAAIDAAFAVIGQTDELLVADTKTAGWEKLPKGWTEESLKEFWDELTGDRKHKVKACIKRMQDEPGIDDAGAFCAALADRMPEMKGWRSEPRSSNTTPVSVDELIRNWGAGHPRDAVGPAVVWLYPVASLDDPPVEWLRKADAEQLYVPAVQRGDVPRLADYLQQEFNDQLAYWLNNESDAARFGDFQFVEQGDEFGLQYSTPAIEDVVRWACAERDRDSRAPAQQLTQQISKQPRGKGTRQPEKPETDSKVKKFFEWLGQKAHEATTRSRWARLRTARRQCGCRAKDAEATVELPTACIAELMGVEYSDKPTTTFEQKAGNWYVEGVDTQGVIDDTFVNTAKAYCEMQTTAKTATVDPDILAKLRRLGLTASYKQSAQVGANTYFVGDLVRYDEKKAEVAAITPDDSLILWLAPYGPTDFVVTDDNDPKFMTTTAQTKEKIAMNPDIARLVQEEFPGRQNAGLRKEIMKAVEYGDPGAVRGLARRLGLTPSGKASLETIARGMQTAAKTAMFTYKGHLYRETALEELPQPRKAETIEFDYDYDGIGKFDSNVDERVYEMSLEGWGEELGDAETFGHYTLLDFGDEPLIVTEPGTKPAKHAAAIVFVNNQGFVQVSYYAMLDDAKADWRNVEQEYEKFLGESDEEF